MNEDPRKDLRSLTETKSLKLSERAVDEATPAQAQLMLMIHELHMSNDRQFGEAFRKIDDAAKHAVEAKIESACLRTDLVIVSTNVKEISDLQKVANGSLGTLKAKVKILEDQRKEETATMTGEIIRSHVQDAASKRVLILPMPTWRQWTVIGCTIAFFGVDRVFSFFHEVGILLSHLH